MAKGLIDFIVGRLSLHVDHVNSHMSTATLKLLWLNIHPEPSTLGKEMSAGHVTGLLVASNPHWEDNNAEN